MRSQPTLNQTGELKAAYLADEDVRELVVEGGAVFRRVEVALRSCPSRGWFRRRG